MQLLHGSVRMGARPCAAPCRRIFSGSASTCSSSRGRSIVVAAKRTRKATKDTADVDGEHSDDPKAWPSQHAQQPCANSMPHHLQPGRMLCLGWYHRRSA